MSLEIINKKIPSNRGKVVVNLANHAPLWADSLPAPVIDSNKRDGWYYTNTGAGDKANIYFFAGTQETLELQHIRSIWAKVAIDNYSGTSVLPFFNVYTKPTGTGDAQAWYHSRFTYTMAADVDIGVGEEVIIHTHFTPSISYDNRTIPMPVVAIEGDESLEQEVLYITIHTDSGAATGDVKILFQNLGFISSAGHTRNLHLVGYEPVATAIQYPTDPNTGILFTTESNRRVDSTQTISIVDSSYGHSTSIHNTHPSEGYVSIFGNSNNQNNDIEVQYSSDNTNWYFASNHYVNFHGGSNGDFAMDFRTAAAYIRVAQYNNHGSTRILTVNLSIV